MFKSRVARLMAFSLCGCLNLITFAQTNKVVPPAITPEKIKPHIVILSDDRFEGRGAGYEGERRAADYIAAQFKKIGLKPIVDTRGRRSYFQEFKFHPRHPVVPWEMLASRNVLGFIEGKDAKLKNEIVVIGAHYDGQGRNGQADPLRIPARDTSTRDDIWNSANDNAASIAAIIEIARAMTSAKIAPGRSILFIAFGAEEHGMSGSIHYVSHPAFPLGNHVAMINLEKLGRSPDKPFSINGSATSSVWPQVHKTIQAQTEIKVSPNIPFATPDSDHYPFSASRVPAVMFYVSSAADEAHQPSDTSDKIDFERTVQAARFVMAMALELSTQANRPEYAASPIPDLGLSAHLATGAEADAVGLNAPEGGLKVTGVIAGLPAAAAGLQPGDLIVEFAQYKFRRDDALMKLMTLHREVLEGKRGFVLPLKVIRDKKQLEMSMNLKR
jgi:hypothetical protein